LDDAPNSRNLSRSLEDAQPDSPLPDSSRVAFAGYVVWRSEENGDRNLYDEQVFLARGGAIRLLPPRTDLANQNPDGFSWGDCGSASAQLALAMLMEVMDDWPRVQRIYHDFHTLFVRKIPRGANWTADGADILAWALELERNLPRHASSEGG
jgi:hypothetical protein